MKTRTAALVMMIPALAATASAENSELADRYAKVYASRRDFSPSNVNPFWIRESSSFWYVRETPEGKTELLSLRMR